MKIKFLFPVFIGFFVLYIFLWLLLNYTQVLPEDARNWYTDSYGICALIGGLIGIRAAKRWGGFTSLFGSAVMLLSIGLLMQFLGQLSYAIYYYVFQVENPYPSFGELFYFGSIPVYIFGIYKLAKVVGVTYGFKSTANKIALIFIPLGLFAFVYATFLKGYEVYDTNPIVIFLDFAYPIGQGIYVSLAVLTFLFARTTLGGVLRTPVFMLLGAFVLQYLADLLYSIKTMNETWQAAGKSDLTYLFAYFFMGFALYLIGKNAEKLKTL